MTAPLWAGVVAPRPHVTTFGPLPGGAESTLAEVAVGQSVVSALSLALALNVYSPRSSSVQSHTKLTPAVVTFAVVGGRSVQSAVPPLLPRSDGETLLTVPLPTLTLSVT